jgi:deoxyribodipyrimidine photo-lyase
MIAARRPFWNFSLQRAVERSVEFGKPLVILEPIRIRYQWASDRLHRFVIEGMADNAAAFADKPVTYYPYVEPAPGRGSPLLRTLAENACVVVTDEYPCFFLPDMVRVAGQSVATHMEMVDGNCLLPMRLADRTFTVAHSYRRWMQKQIGTALTEMPLADPLATQQLPRLRQLPDTIRRRWPSADLTGLLQPGGLSSLEIDHSVAPSTLRGGWRTANDQLQSFLNQRLVDYDEARNQPDLQGSSGLSPYLHFGHLSAHQMVAEILRHENWQANQLGQPNGKNHDFWNTSLAAEALLDQLLTWRELGFNMCHRHPTSYDAYESLPAWALSTLSKHANDPRPFLYSREQFEQAKTHDALWNAAQRQLLVEGKMHNYLRMLWGKMILHWSPTPQEALATMIHLNNKYALDGRDPNSYSGIFWTLGRYDRAWGPLRPVFGSVRYMTSDSTRRKLKLTQYLKRWSGKTSASEPSLF